MIRAAANLVHFVLAIVEVVAITVTLALFALPFAIVAATGLGGPEREAER